MPATQTRPGVGSGLRAAVPPGFLDPLLGELDPAASGGSGHHGRGSGHQRWIWPLVVDLAATWEGASAAGGGAQGRSVPPPGKEPTPPVEELGGGGAAASASAVPAQQIKRKKRICLGCYSCAAFQECFQYFRNY
jgi:hypothetical protein